MGANNARARTQMPSEKQLSIQRAAVRFANDYGPLAAANAGDPTARHVMAERLVDILKEQGLGICIRPFIFSIELQPEVVS